MATEPSDREAEYFLKLNQEKIKKLRTDLDRKREGEAKEKPKEAMGSTKVYNGIR